MNETLPAAGALLQFRKGGEVLLARAVGAKNGKVLASGEDGRRLELPPDRVLQVAGEVAAALSDADARERLREVGAAAEGLVGGVDLRLLWEQVRGDLEGAPIADLVSVYFGRTGAAGERLAFGFALCGDRTYFRQKGERFVPRMESEVEESLERREAERRAAERRAAFLRWAREGTQRGAMAGPPPEGSASELAAIEDLAVRGDEAPQGGRAKTLLKEIAAEAPAGAPRHSPSPDGAFEFLVRLGIFTEHENLALRRTGIPAAFPPDVLAAATEVPAYPEGGDPARRALPDGLAIVTIDDVETEDRDDAVSIEVLPEGGYRLGIHIAAVASFVARGSRLDDEALRRGTTVYLPRGKLAMFPPILSERRMSLEADGARRPAFTFWVTLGPDYAPKAEWIEATSIRVTRNLSYDEVDAELANGAGGGSGGAWPEARLLDAISKRLLRDRIAAGALDLQTPEVKVIVDPAGHVSLRRIEGRSPARALVAELMILANAIAARFCRERGIPAIYRRQPGPGEPLPAAADCASPEVHAFEVRRRLGRTEIGHIPGPHFTLGLDAYMQATSPIRRYGDLAIERQIEAALRGEPLPYSPDEIQTLAANAEAASGESTAVERETTQYWLIRWLSERREPMDAVVLMERDGKYLVELADSLYRGFVRARARWQVGARVRVRVEGANPRRGEATLVPG